MTTKAFQFFFLSVYKYTFIFYFLGRIGYKELRFIVGHEKHQTRAIVWKYDHPPFERMTTKNKRHVSSMYYTQRASRHFKSFKDWSDWIAETDREPFSRVSKTDQTDLQKRTGTVTIRSITNICSPGGKRKLSTDTKKNNKQTKNKTKR